MEEQEEQIEIAEQTPGQKPQGFFSKFEAGLDRSLRDINQAMDNDLAMI